MDLPYFDIEAFCAFVKPHDTTERQSRLLQRRSKEIFISPNIHLLQRFIHLFTKSLSDRIRDNTCSIWYDICISSNIIPYLLELVYGLSPRTLSESARNQNKSPLLYIFPYSSVLTLKSLKISYFLIEGETEK